MDFMDAHTHSFSSDKNVLSLVNTYPDATDFASKFSIGIHPWFINKATVEKDINLIEEKLQHINCLALGECGLDKVSTTNFELQNIVFRKQIHLSEKYQKPLIIHCVKAYQEIIEIKKEVNPKQIWILHGFNKSLQIAESLLKNDIVLSFGAAIIKNKKLQKVFLEVPVSSILLETDDTEFEIQEIYKKAASIKKIEVEVLQQKIKQNFKRIFKE